MLLPYKDFHRNSSWQYCCLHIALTSLSQKCCSRTRILIKSRLDCMAVLIWTSGTILEFSLRRLLLVHPPLARLFLLPVLLLPLLLSFFRFITSSSFTFFTSLARLCLLPVLPLLLLLLLLPPLFLFFRCSSFLFSSLLFLSFASILWFYISHVGCRRNDMGPGWVVYVTATCVERATGCSYRHLGTKWTLNPKHLTLYIFKP